MKSILVNGTNYQVIKALGKGKSGYSYLVNDGKNDFVLKKIHHEPVDYYQFGDKFQSEIHAYLVLSKLGITMPKLITHDKHQEIIIKEYIEGLTIFEQVLNDIDVTTSIIKMKDICISLYKENINIDYFPTNFILKDDLLYYIDYEYNQYMEKWNFENWGIHYWYKSEKFLSYVKEKH